MHLLVAIKQVPDPAIPARPAPGGGTEVLFAGADARAVRATLNPFDAIALEAAVQLKEQGHAQRVTTVAVGPEEWLESLRTTLALGADAALLVATPTPPAPLALSRCLAAVARREGVSLLLAGKQSSDGDHAQTGPMTAARLGWSQATNASRVTVEGEWLRVIREVDGGLEEVLAPLPAVVTADLRLATPRYASLPAIMQARTKPLATLPVGELGVELEDGVEWLGYRDPPLRPPGQRVGSVGELVTRLRHLGVLA